MNHTPIDRIELLLAPQKVGPLELRNRFCMPAMHLNFTMGGEVSDQLVDFYAERARGGVALITVGGCSIDTAGGGPMFVGLHDDRFIPGLARLAAAIHEGGALAVAQLYQAGKYAHSQFTGEQAVSASAIRSKLTNETPRELSLEEIPEVQGAFSAAARRAFEAGFDGVEVLASAGYLISQFLSPVSNKREDAYGGSFDNRARFGREVVEQVRAVATDKAVVVRVAGADFVPGGHTNKESAAASRVFVEAGADAINVTGGWHETRLPQLTMGVPRGAFLYLARGIREALDGVPVIASNRCNDAALAEAALRDGMADLINFGRPLIADPQLPNKVIKRAAGVVHCVACNQGCFDHVFSGRPVSCMVNPRAGQEARRVLAPAAKPRRVLVVGGGPGGMTAAATAARRGHEVTLVERDAHLGGQLRLAAHVPGREEMATLVGDLARQLTDAGVTVERSTEASAEMVSERAVDAVVLATGARPVAPPIEGAELPHVVQAWDVLCGAALAGRRVVIVGGGSVAVETAMSLARRGTLDAETARFLLVNGAEDPEQLRRLCLEGSHEITVVEADKRVGQGIGKTTRWTLTQLLKQQNVKMLGSTRAERIDAEGVWVSGEDGERLLPADTVIIALGSESHDPFGDALADREDLEVIRIGDLKKPRRAFEAIHEGFKVGLKL